MRSKKNLNVIETHTGGQPTRTVVSGVLNIPGKTMAEKYAYMQEQGDYVRKMVCMEPRGSEIMSGTLITQACDPAADVGILHFEAAGWLPMCGHNTIGACTALAETGMIACQEPETTVTLETPIGLIQAVVEMKDGIAQAVRFRNCPAFPLLLGGTINVPNYGEVPVDIGWGGSAVAFLETSRFGLTVCPENAHALENLGVMIRQLVNEKYPIRHPMLPQIQGISHVSFYEDEPVMRHAVVGPDGRCDRSPCGNGTCARAAILYAQGKLKAGDSFTQRSVLGSVFSCKCAETVDENTIIPEIRGQAWITAQATYLLAEDDTLGQGFLL